MGKSKKVLKAPHKITATVGSSQGDVEFVDGVATEFTQAQADHYLNNFNGYELIDAEPEEDENKTSLAKLSANIDLANIAAELDEGNDEPVEDEPESAVEKTSLEAIADKIPDSVLDEETDKDSEKGDEEVDEPATEEEDADGEDDWVLVDEPFPDIVPSEKDHINEIRTFIKDYAVDKDGARKKADMLKAIRRDSRFKE